MGSPPPPLPLSIAGIPPPLPVLLAITHRNITGACNHPSPGLSASAPTAHARWNP
jgi:hypothetical protein